MALWHRVFRMGVQPVLHNTCLHEETSACGFHEGSGDSSLGGWRAVKAHLPCPLARTLFAAECR